MGHIQGCPIDDPDAMKTMKPRVMEQDLQGPQAYYRPLIEETHIHLAVMHAQRIDTCRLISHLIKYAPLVEMTVDLALPYAQAAPKIGGQLSQELFLDNSAIKIASEDGVYPRASHPYPIAVAL